jgi:hypothetical protein
MAAEATPVAAATAAGTTKQIPSPIVWQTTAPMNRGRGTQGQIMSGSYELRHESGQNKLRAMVLYEQEGSMSNFRVFLWLTWLMACKLLTEVAPLTRQRRSAGEI